MDPRRRRDSILCPQCPHFKKDQNPGWPATLSCILSLGHVQAKFSKPNVITRQVFQPLKNYSIRGLIYNITSKRLASSELTLSPNDAGCTPEGGTAPRLPQPFVFRRKVGVSSKTNPLLNTVGVIDNLCHTCKYVSRISVQ